MSTLSSAHTDSVSLTASSLRSRSSADVTCYFLRIIVKDQKADAGDHHRRSLRSRRVDQSIERLTDSLSFLFPALVKMGGQGEKNGRDKEWMEENRVHVVNGDRPSLFPRSVLSYSPGERTRRERHDQSE
jgi:hypothetical protein